MSYRSQCPRAADIDRNIENLRLLLLRGILKRDGPARSLRGKSELPLLRNAIDFEHHAIDLIRQVVAFRFPLRAERQSLLRVSADPPLGIHLESLRHQPFQRVPMAVEEELALSVQREVGVIVETPRGRNARLQNPQRACRRVTWIGETRQA